MLMKSTTGEFIKQLFFLWQWSNIQEYNVLSRDKNVFTKNNKNNKQ